MTPRPQDIGVGGSLRQCDVVVVGGGPAGSTVAAALVRAGRDVVLLDKASFPRDKVCAGWVTPAVFEELGISPQEYGDGGRTLQPIHGFRLGLMRGRTVTLRYPQTVSYGILRRELDDFLLRRSGADLVLGTPITSLERVAEKWVVNGAYEAPLLIGAGGHFCPVARHLVTGRDEVEPIVVAQELELALSAEQAAECAVEVDVPELTFSEDLLGYGWCFRKGAYLNVGLGRQDRSGLKEHVEEFVRWLEETHRIPRGLQATGGRFKGHAYLVFGQSKRPVVADGVLLVGDAAGLAYPASGEGIRPAVESALLAASLVSGLSRFQEDDLRPYAERLRQRLASGRFGAAVAGIVPASILRSAARRLLGSRWFARRTVVDGWFLHRGQAPLVTGSSAAASLG
jgi:geranylgeranyl reductase family protein